MSASAQDLVSADPASSSGAVGVLPSPNGSVARVLGIGGGGGGGGGKGDVWSRLTKSGSTTLLNDNRYGRTAIRGHCVLCSVKIFRGIAAINFI